MISLAAGVLAISALSAAAAPPLISGFYTATGTPFCQVITGGKAIDPMRSHGKSEHFAARLAFVNGAGGATATMNTADQWVRLIAPTASVEYQTAKIPITLAISGTGNPYDLKFTMTTSKGKSTQDGKIILGNVTGGIAGRAMFLTARAYDHSTTPNCSMLVTLFKD
jgi:hypothetical protein